MARSEILVTYGPEAMRITESVTKTVYVSRGRPFVRSAGKRAIDYTPDGHPVPPTGGRE